MQGFLSRTNHRIFCSSPITNCDLTLHISLHALARARKFFGPYYKLFLTRNILTASWAVTEAMQCPMLPKGFPLPTLPHTLGLLFSPFFFATSSLCFAGLFSFYSSLEKNNIPPLSLAVWVTEKEKSAQCQQEFSPTAGTWTFSSGAQCWVTALKQARLIWSACSRWEAKHQ